MEGWWKSMEVYGSPMESLWKSMAYGSQWKSMEGLWKYGRLMEVHGRVMEGLWKVNGRLNGRLMEAFCQNPKVAWLPLPVPLTFLSIKYSFCRVTFTQFYKENSPNLYWLEFSSLWKVEESKHLFETTTFTKGQTLITWWKNLRLLQPSSHPLLSSKYDLDDHFQEKLPLPSTFERQ